MDVKESSALYQELAARHGWPASKYLPLILQKVATPEQAQILLQLPATPDEIAEKLGVDKKSIDDNLNDLFNKGLAFPGKKGWRLGRIIDSLHDLTLSNTNYWDSFGGTEYADLWKAFEINEWWPEFVDNVLSTGRGLVRVLPAWETIKDNPDRLDIEDIREIYKKAKSIAVVPCPCKRENYNKTCNSPDEVCIALNSSAEYNLKRGVGKKLTVEEALDLEKEVRKHNLITHVPNSTVTNMTICHCHTCCCTGFLAFKQQRGSVNSGFSDKSRYLSVVTDIERCTGCQLCLDACQFEAIEMKKHPGMTRWKAFINPEICMGCGNCAIRCPKKGTITLKIVRPPEHIPQGEVDIYAYGHVQK